MCAYLTASVLVLSVCFTDSVQVVNVHLPYCFCAGGKCVLTLLILCRW